MSSNYFGGSQGENFSSSPEVSVSENTDKPVESDKKTGSSISDNMEKNSENGLENPDKNIGDSTPDEVDESQNDDWDDIDKYLGDGTGRKESNGNSYGEYVVEVTYLADSNEDEQETHDMMEMAYSETSSPENMHELKERIEERSENIEVVDAQVISKPEISDSPERIEKSVEPPVEEQTEAIESPTGIPEPRAEMSDKPNDTKEMDDEVPESSNEALDSNEVSESIQTDEKSEMNGETAYALSFETASNAEELNKRFEDEFYKQGKHDKKEIGSIQADTTRLLNEIETQKASLDKAIQSTHEEIYEYVTEGNMSRFETERDSHYISMIEKYKSYQSQREKLDYYSTKLDDNNSRLAEITGKTGEDALAEVLANNKKSNFFDRFFNRQNQGENQSSFDLENSGIPDEIGDEEYESIEEETEEYNENNVVDNEEKTWYNDSKELQIEKIKSRNEDLEGKEHPESGVPFERRLVEVDGKQYEIVAPRFESTYDAQLPNDKLKATDREQFKECNEQLKENIANNPELRKRFDDEQLEQIENGDTPDGYTWHHDVDVGRMQLVDTETHQKTGHTGGRSLWGGGTDNR